MIDIFQESDFGGSWKSIQTGLILTSTNIRSISQYLFSKGYQFLPGRLTQDALENVFSQIRRKAGLKSTAVQVKSAIKMIYVSQFISDIKNSSYASESNYHLFDFPNDSSVAPPVSQINENDPTCPSTSRVPDAGDTRRIVADENDIYYIAGNTVHAIGKCKSVCDACKDAMSRCIDSNEPEVPAYRQYLNNFCNMGGLKSASSGIYRICRETEKIIQAEKSDLLSEKTSVNNLFIQKIKSKCTAVTLPTCCYLKERIILHYVTVRCIGLKNQAIKRKSHEKHYASKSMSKRQKLDA